MKKSIIFGLILLTIIGFILIFLLVSSSRKNVPKPSSPTSPPPISKNQSDSPRIVSTKPDPLNETIIPANQIIEITFNKPLQNVPEFKIRFEPKIDFKVELSADRKTAKITPTKSFELGAEFTLSIAPDTKFDGVGNWGVDKSFHFRTIKYRGI